MRPRLKGIFVCSTRTMNMSGIRHWCRPDKHTVIEITNITTVTKPRCYVKCFGKLVELSEADALRISDCMTIIRK